MLTENQRQLADSHVHVVEKLAKCYARRSHAFYDDAVQYGAIGLMQAARSFRPDGGAAFETWATRRINGAILDGFRCEQWVARDAAKWARRHGRDVPRMVSRDAMEERIEREDTDHGLAMFHPETFDPGAAEESDQWRHLLRPIPDHRVRLAIRLYADERLTMKEIAQVLGLSESMVSVLIDGARRLLASTTMQESLAKGAA